VYKLNYTPKALGYKVEEKLDQGLGGTKRARSENAGPENGGIVPRHVIHSFTPQRMREECKPSDGTNSTQQDATCQHYRTRARASV
jgi:hypothetical protein